MNLAHLSLFLYSPLQCEGQELVYLIPSCGPESVTTSRTPCAPHKYLGAGSLGGQETCTRIVVGMLPLASCLSSLTVPRRADYSPWLLLSLPQNSPDFTPKLGHISSYLLVTQSGSLDFTLNPSSSSCHPCPVWRASQALDSEHPGFSTPYFTPGTESCWFLLCTSSGIHPCSRISMATDAIPNTPPLSKGDVQTWPRSLSLPAPLPSSCMPWTDCAFAPTQLRLFMGSHGIKRGRSSWQELAATPSSFPAMLLPGGLMAMADDDKTSLSLRHQ